MGGNIQVILRVPKFVFVPLEYVNGKWSKRDDLPRFKEPEEAAQYLLGNPQISMRDGKPVFLQWQERDEPSLIQEYLRGVGTPEYLTLKH
jgi:hypothetical protein